MARVMSYEASTMTGSSSLEEILRHELARGDVALAGVAPVLTHLLSGSGQSLVSDAIIAHMRGMIADLARQLLQAQRDAGGETASAAAIDADLVDALSQRLIASTVVLSHIYALAVEAHYANSLEVDAAIDPVLSPLLQELIASDNDEVAELAMAAMAAQARFMQAQRRMNLPLRELPSDLFHQVLSIWRRFGRDVSAEVLQQAEAAMREQHDEASSRLGLFSHLVSGLKGAVHAALRIDHAGISLFASAIASVTRQPRELAILACHEGQVARLALTLRGAGVKPEEVVRQIALIHPTMELPEGFGELSERQALSMLGSARSPSTGASARRA